jgi:circadian clock protein KaiC
LESNGERRRGLYVLKSRGMAHSNQIREYVITDNGIELRDTSSPGVQSGKMRTARKAKVSMATRVGWQETERKQSDLERKGSPLEA